MRHSSIIPNIQYAPLHIYRRQNNIQPIKLINYCYLEDIHRFYRDWLSMSIFSDYSSSSEMHNNLTIDYYLALSSTKGSGITNIISIILQQAQDYDVAKIT